MILLSLLLQVATPSLGDLPPEIDPSEIPGMGAPAPQASDQTAREEAGERDLRTATRRVERVGELYRVYGRCTGSMETAEIETLLRTAQQSAAGAYLLGEYEKGFRSARSDAWCRDAVGKALGRLGASG